ncbi:MAG: HAD-IC family P-type ATPase, partial [Clostridia bacterium]
MGEQAEPTYEQVEAELGKEVAATAVTTSSASTIDLPVYQAQMDIPEALRSIPVMNARGRPSAERIPTPLILSVAGLAVLGVKQLFLGRSALARSPGPFYLSGLLAIATGYPLMKRGLQHGQAEKKWNMDVILGTSALALALVRENVIVLAGLSLLHFVNWRREQVLPQAENLEMSQTHLSPTIRSYREKASKWGMILGGATLAITRSPMRALGVLLAANPRPATMAEEYTWKQAQLASHEKGLVIPENGSLPQLSRTHTVLLEDTSLLCSSCEGEKVMVVAHEEEDKVWSMAASLLKKSCHPWKDEVINHAIDTGRTIRTAFQVEEHPEGLKGKVNNVDVLIGTAAFLRENGLECDDYSLEAKRRRKAGYSVQFVVKKLAKTTKCLGLLVKREHDLSEEGKALLSEFSQRGWNVGVIRNQGNIDLALLQKNGVDVDWLSATESELYEKITALRQQEEDVLLVKKANRSTSLEVPAITIEQVKHIHQTIDYARRMRHIVHQHFVITKIWNAAGVLLAIPYAVTAPLVNLIADGLSLVFHSRAKRLSEQEYGLLGEAKDRGPYMQIGEVAAAAAFEGGPCWHAMPQEAVLGQFGVHETHGLCEEQIHFLRSQFGPNQLQMTKPSSWLRSFFGQFQEFTTLILLGASALALVTGGIFDGLAMGTVLLANAAIGTMQEKKAEKVIEALNRFQPPPCKVIREGRTEEISGGELVPGDIVYLEAGDRVPADLRIIQAWNLEVNEAALTGESLPVAKQAEPVEEQLPLPERKSMVYMGTDVTRGKALAVVVKTGMDTEMGHLTSLMKAEEVKATPLQQKVTSISKTFMKGALLVGGLVFATGLLRGVPLMEMISTSITLIASAIPEGLPVTITIALSAGIFRMAKKQSIVRKLSALETLGRTTVICSDKTGTLTKNEMTVKTIATPGQLWMVTGEGYSPDGSIVTGAVEEVAVSSHAAVAHREDDQPDHHPDLDRLVQIGLLCNNSMLEENGGRWLVKGDPTEGALICLARKNGFLPENALSWKRH